MTKNELKALLYIGGCMDAPSHGICRAIYPDRNSEQAATGAAFAVHLRRKGLVMQGHCQGTWRLTAKGREAWAQHHNLGPFSITGAMSDKLRADAKSK